MLSPDPVKRGLNRYHYCDNDPVNYEDSTGEIANILIGGALGAITGGAFGFGGSVVSQLIGGQKVDWRKAAGAAANGAITGDIVYPGICRTGSCTSQNGTAKAAHRIVSIDGAAGRIRQTVRDTPADAYVFSANPLLSGASHSARRKIRS